MYEREQKLILQYAYSNTARSIFEYVVTWSMLFLTYYFLFKSINAHSFLTAPLVLLQTLVVIRLFILQHDCGHYALFKSRLVNNVAGVACSLFTTMTYHYWRDTHAVHHRVNGDLSARPWTGAIDVITLDEFNQLNPQEQKSYLLKRNLYVLLLFGWFYHFYNYRINLPVYNGKLVTKKYVMKIYLTNFVQLTLFVLIAILYSVKFLILSTLLPMIFSYCIGIFLFYIQHNFETSYFFTEQEKSEIGKEIFMKSSFDGSSCFLLPPILAWFTGNIGYHHIHHACPKVPFYHLKKMYDTHPELQNVYTITLNNAFKQFSYKLYDPIIKKMLGWHR